MIKTEAPVRRTAIRAPARMAIPPRRRREPDNKRRLLLEAAIAAFSEKGLTGARVDDIALVAGVNKQLVYHYFDNKDGLYSAALEEAYARFRAREEQLSVEDLPAQEGLARLIERIFDSCVGLRDVVALIADENRHLARHVRGSTRIMAMHRPVITTIKALLARGVGEGVFRDRVNPVHLFVSILGLSMVPITNGHTLSAIFDVDLTVSRELKHYRSHVVQFTLQALAPSDA